MSTPFLGEIRLFAFPRVPYGWLSCDGSLQRIADYDALYSLLGTTYGGDGVQTFGLPDMRGQVPLHQGTRQGLSPRPLGQSGGFENVTLMADTMPAHSHPYAVATGLANATAPAAGVQLGAAAGDDKLYTSSIAGLTPFGMAPAAIAGAGASQPHDNTMPTLTVSFCISVSGIYPQQP